MYLSLMYHKSKSYFTIQSILWCCLEKISAYLWHFRCYVWMTTTILQFIETILYLHYRLSVSFLRITFSFTHYFSMYIWYHWIIWVVGIPSYVKWRVTKTNHRLTQYQFHLSLHNIIYRAYDSSWLTQSLPAIHQMLKMQRYYRWCVDDLECVVWKRCNYLEGEIY